MRWQSEEKDEEEAAAGAEYEAASPAMEAAAQPEAGEEWQVLCGSNGFLSLPRCLPYNIAAIIWSLKWTLVFNGCAGCSGSGPQLICAPSLCPSPSAGPLLCPWLGYVWTHFICSQLQLNVFLRLCSTCSILPATLLPALVQLVMKLTTLSTRRRGKTGSGLECPLQAGAVSCDKRSPLPALKCHLRVTAVKCLLRVKCPRNIIFLPLSLLLSLSHTLLCLSHSLSWLFFLALWVPGRVSTQWQP